MLIERFSLFATLETYLFNCSFSFKFQGSNNGSYLSSHSRASAYKKRLQVLYAHCVATWERSLLLFRMVSNFGSINYIYSQVGCFFWPWSKFSAHYLTYSLLRIRFLVLMSCCIQTRSNLSFWLWFFILHNPNMHLIVVYPFIWTKVCIYPFKQTFWCDCCLPFHLNKSLVFIQHSDVTLIRSWLMKAAYFLLKFFSPSPCHHDQVVTKRIIKLFDTLYCTTLTADFQVESEVS